MPDLTPDHHADREAARRDNGEFGTHSRTSPEVHLADGNGFRDPSYPLTLEVVLERWDNRDNAIELGVVEFDARALCDARSLTELDQAFETGDPDAIFFEAVDAGLTDAHDGPFTVRTPEEFDDYVTHRENSGMNDAYPNAAEIVAAAALEAKMSKRAKALETAARLLKEAGPGATVTMPVTELTPGEVLVRGMDRVRVNEVTASSTMPGFTMVDTDFGYLYLASDQEVTVEAS